MPAEQGTVQEVSGGKALVRIRKSSACAHCGSRGACQVFSDREMCVEAANDPQAKVGDFVEIRVPERALLKLSFLVYFLPVLALVIGAMAGGSWAGYLYMEPTLASIIAGCFAMGITFCLIKWINRGARTGNKYLPRITRVLTNAASPQPDDNI